MNQKRPAIAEIIELLGKKWVMRIIWELRSGPLPFRELQAACGDISPTTLNSRLKLLKHSLLVENQDSQGYGLSPLGEELLEIYQPLKGWAIKWQKRL